MRQEEEDMFLRNEIIVAHFITALINIHCVPFFFYKKEKKKRNALQQKSLIRTAANQKATMQKYFSRFLLLLLPFLEQERQNIWGYRRYARHSHKIIIFDLNGLNEQPRKLHSPGVRLNKLRRRGCREPFVSNR